MTRTRLLHLSIVVVGVAASALLASFASFGAFLLHGRISALIQGVPLDELSEDFGGAFDALLISTVVFLAVLLLGMYASKRFSNWIMRKESNVNQRTHHE